MAYSPNEAGRKIAAEIIKQKRPDLKGKAIDYLFTNKKLSDKGKQVAAKTKKAGDLEGYYGNVQVVVIFSEAWWETYEGTAPSRLRALVDHELMHIVESEGDLELVGHDFEGFVEEVKEHGFWSSGLEELESGLRQMNLPFMEAKPAKGRGARAKSSNGRTKEATL